MKVFISWSGERSKKTAEALKEWLQQVIQAVDPWFSGDIEKGKRWSKEISAELEKSKIGIICLNRNNIDEPWLHFEAGAIAKTKDALVCTFLLDLLPSDVKQPLGQFQHTQFDKEDVRKLMHTINQRVRDVGEKALTEKLLDSTFDKFWSDLKGKLEKIVTIKEKGTVTTRTDRDILEEMLDMLRGLQGKIEVLSDTNAIDKYNKLAASKLLFKHLSLPPTESLKDKEHQKELKDLAFSLLQQYKIQTEDNKNNSKE